MKIVLGLVGLVVAVPLMYLGILYGASELGGEVVTLSRAEADGSVSQVRLWIVDQNEVAWIEHGAPDSHWMSLLAAGGELEISRNGRSQRYKASLAPQAHDLYHQLRQEKYTWANVVVGWLTPQDAGSVPVRLEKI